MALGVVTIGQAPRVDMVPEMAVHWPGVSVLERGALDGWTSAEIGAVPIVGGDEVLTSRLSDGGSAVFGRELILPLLQQRIAELEQHGVEATLLVCTGEFPQFDHSRPLFTASNLLSNGVAALAGGLVGVICPLAEQQDDLRRKFEPQVTVTAVANPYGGSPADFVAATEQLSAKGVGLIVLDCMGYTEEHRSWVRSATDIPVVLARSLVARLVGEVVSP